MFIRALSLFLSVITMIWAAKQTATTTTTITPNSKAVVEMSGSNYYVGLQTGTVIYWSTTLNSTFSTGYVLSDTGNAVVTFKKGITVTIQDNAGKYSLMSLRFFSLIYVFFCCGVGSFPTYILLNGQIVDNQSPYNITGFVCAEFPGN
jgi:hypothetical protein